MRQTHGLWRRSPVQGWHQGAVRGVVISSTSSAREPARWAAVHADGPSADGWTVVVIHDSRASWETFRDSILMPRMQEGINGGFAEPPQETVFDVVNEVHA